ncbi:hypothetical protein E6W39_29255 [Kitasatospora acidiphila]|uniref:CD-NTase-associated protein 12/Pycsar effector protein TIR domain-containing protein n=1 Tax=Kitasatospora acidiphila TaxID=2567942 RepID=A0A540W985_9ACTN|nr:nucleotide-binding protein [Kitasatospora acidiphila]TQF05573.1 hypothetical protein E6W39_29255 [Kitasatospora acidiphila]
MKESERLLVILPAADRFVQMSEGEARAVLSYLGFENPQDSLFWVYSEEVKKGIWLRFLRDASDEAISRLREFLGIEIGATESTRTKVDDREKLSDPIFVVHGHDSALLYEVLRLLERTTQREVVVLREQLDHGRTVLEKLEDHTTGIAYAVVLLTGDDLGQVKSGGDLRPRARQNVVFELGYLFGKLGRKYIAVIYEDGVELPSDITGLVYISRASQWKLRLAHEVGASGIEVDYRQIV